MLDMAAREGLEIAGAHVNAPGFGHVVRKGATSTSNGSDAWSIRLILNVRFTRECGHSSAQSACPLCAISGREQMQQHERAKARVTRSPRRRGRAVSAGTFEAERLGGFKVDQQIKTRRLLRPAYRLASPL